MSKRVGTISLGARPGTPAGMLHMAVAIGRALVAAKPEPFTERTLHAAAEGAASLEAATEETLSASDAVARAAPGAQPLVVGMLPECAYDLVGAMALHGAGGCAASVVLLGDDSRRTWTEVLLLVTDGKHDRHALLDVSAGEWHLLGDTDNAMPAWFSASLRGGARRQCWAYTVPPVPVKKEAPVAPAAPSKAKKVAPKKRAAAEPEVVADEPVPKPVKKGRTKKQVPPKEKEEADDDDDDEVVE